MKGTSEESEDSLWKRRRKPSRFLNSWSWKRIWECDWRCCDVWCEELRWRRGCIYRGRLRGFGGRFWREMVEKRQIPLRISSFCEGEAVACCDSRGDTRRDTRRVGGKKSVAARLPRVAAPWGLPRRDTRRLEFPELSFLVPRVW